MGISREQFANLIKGMKSVYAQQSFMPDKDSFDVWYEILKDISYEVLSAAIMKYMSTQHFAPTPSDIRALCVDVTTGTKTDFGVGWQQVLRAIHTYGMYQKEEALQSFDEITRQCVERLGWQQLCTSEDVDHDRANFRMIYESIQSRHREENQLSVSLNNTISSIAEKSKTQLEVKHEVPQIEQSDYEPVTDTEQLEQLTSQLLEKLGGGKK